MTDEEGMANYRRMVGLLAQLEPPDQIEVLATLTNDGMPPLLARNLLADAVIRHCCPGLEWEASDVSY
jgi:hypothetical protein